MSQLIKNKLTRYNKTELIDKLLKNILGQQEFKKESDSVIKALNDKIHKLEKELKTLRASSVERLTDVQILREVLALKATGKSTGRIYETLNDIRGIDVDIEVVKSITDNLDELSEENKKYYNEQKKVYFDNLQFNKENIRLEDIQSIQLMIDSSKKALESMEFNLSDDDFNFDDYRKLQDHISKLIKSKNDILKSITGDGDEDEDGEEFEIKYAEDKSEELDLTIVGDDEDEQ